MNILLIDDHTLFGKSLQIALSDFTEINNFYILQNTDNLMTMLNKEHIDIILIDIDLGNGKNGLTLAKSILSTYKDIKIVMLTGYDLPVYRYEAKKIGAKGFLKKSILLDNFIKILLDINNGYSYFPNTNNYIEELTNREKLILQYLYYGYNRKNISNMLQLSERTISNHIQNIFSKLDVSSSLEAISKGLQLGYIQPNYNSKF